jgi:hypothetical protein
MVAPPLDARILAQLSQEPLKLRLQLESIRGRRKTG